MGTFEDVATRECNSADEEHLRDIAKEYSEARDLATEANHRKDELREKILVLVGDARKVVAGPFFISVSEQMRTTIDHAALRSGAAQAGFDLTPYNKVTATKVLRVT